MGRGAESMEVMGQRLLPTSAVICSGNVLLLQGKKYSPPFTISAIGPPELMKHALDNSQAVQIYKQYVDAFGLGYEVKDEERLNSRAHRCCCSRCSTRAWTNSPVHQQGDTRGES